MSSDLKVMRSSLSLEHLPNALQYGIPVAMHAEDNDSFWCSDVGHKCPKVACSSEKLRLPPEAQN